MSRIFLPTAKRPSALAVPRPPAPRPVAAVELGDGAVTLRLYEEIDATGWWGTSAAAFADTLAGIGGADVHVRINSPGGDVFDGIAIANTLRAHPGGVKVTVDGVAASIASVIAIAGDELVMSPNAELMIHNAWGITGGGAEDIRKFADLLDHLSENIAGAYASKAGGTADQWREYMNEETWFSAESSVEAGLADLVSTPARALPAAAMARTQHARIRANLRRAS